MAIQSTFVLLIFQKKRKKNLHISRSYNANKVEKQLLAMNSS